MQRAAETALAGGERDLVVEGSGHESGLGAHVAGLFPAREIRIEAGVERSVQGERASETVGGLRGAEGEWGSKQEGEEQELHGSDGGIKFWTNSNWGEDRPEVHRATGVRVG